MARYVIDTSLYIRATRSEEANHELERFFHALTPEVYIHSVVVMELLSGAIKPELRRKTHAALVAPFEKRGRVLTPTHAAFVRAADAIAELIRKKKLSAGGIPTSFVNDCLIAASAKDHGFVLVTENTRDFSRLSEVLPFRYVSPWPEAES